MLELREHSADGYRRGIRRDQRWHICVKVSENAIGLDVLLNLFQHRFAIPCPDRRDILAKEVANGFCDVGEALHEL